MLSLCVYYNLFGTNEKKKDLTGWEKSLANAINALRSGWPEGLSKKLPKVYKQSPNVHKKSPNVYKKSPNVNKKSPNVNKKSPKICKLSLKNSLH